MVVFQFPPYEGSSAVQRALRFVQHLPAFGWDPVVLTAQTRAYERVASTHETLPAGVHVERAFALDTKRHLAVNGRYPSFLALPDRWWSWQWDGVRAGTRLIRRFEPAVIWSTYPIVSAHEIARRLAAASGLPWIADFRDPMVEEAFPEDAAVRENFARRELGYARVARAFTVTTPGMAKLFAERYASSPHRPAIELVENGYDEGSFEQLADARAPLRQGRLTLLHSGGLYPVIRDPVHVFAAVRRLIDAGILGEQELAFRFRGTGDDAIVLRAAAEHRLQASIEVMPYVSHREALDEMMDADGLVILQGADCNRQIPAKLYEYMRSGRPILGITDPAGDTGRALLDAGYDCVAALDDADAIARMLHRFVDQLRRRGAAVAPAAVVAAASRRSRTATLARLLDRLAGGDR
jgi:glycosyltransferase involved in cell wall biosynthesis